jgi:hypothetical protein
VKVGVSLPLADPVMSKLEAYATKNSNKKTGVWNNTTRLF